MSLEREAYIEAALIKPGSPQQVSRALELEQERSATLEAELLRVSEELLEVHALSAQFRPVKCLTLPQTNTSPCIAISWKAVIPT